MDQDPPTLGYFAGGTHHYPQRVFLEDISGGNHVYNGAFLRYLERARTAMFQLAESLDPSLGRQPYEEYQVAALDLRFLRPASLHDILVVTTRIGQVGRSSCRLEHAIHGDGTELVKAGIVLVFTQAGRPFPQPRGWQKLLSQTATALGAEAS